MGSDAFTPGARVGLNYTSSRKLTGGDSRSACASPASARRGPFPWHFLQMSLLTERTGTSAPKSSACPLRGRLRLARCVMLSLVSCYFPSTAARRATLNAVRWWLHTTVRNRTRTRASLFWKRQRVLYRCLAAGRVLPLVRFKTCVHATLMR